MANVITKKSKIPAKKESPLVGSGQVLIQVWWDKQYVALVSTLHTANTVRQTRKSQKVNKWRTQK